MQNVLSNNRRCKVAREGARKDRFSNCMEKAHRNSQIFINFYKMQLLLASRQHIRTLKSGCFGINKGRTMTRISTLGKLTSCKCFAFKKCDANAISIL